MVIRAQLNTQDKGDLFVERTGDGDFLVKLEDLKSIGFKAPAGRVVLVAHERYLSLRSMQGVVFEFQEDAVVLRITADPHLLLSQSFGAGGLRDRPRGGMPVGNSAFLNYALTVSGQAQSQTTLGIATELGIRAGDYLLLSDAATVQQADGGRRSVRLASSITHDDRQELRRTVIGDFFTPSRDFNTGLNLGGVSVSKLYSLNPYFVQFPTHSVGGTVAVPSELEVYLDGQRIRLERVQPGEFEVSNILAYGGARNVQVVLRDAFGRVQQLNYSFYFSDQPLRQGLHEYSYGIGAIRRAYGVESNRYGPLALSLFHRYGASDWLTMGWRAEASSKLINTGPLATLVAGSAGTISMAFTASSIDGQGGTAALAAYNYQGRRWSIGLSHRRDWGTYVALGDPPFASNRRSEGSISASYSFQQRGTVAASHSFLRTLTGSNAAPAAGASGRPYAMSLLIPRRVSSLSYSTPLISGRATLSATLSSTKQEGSARRTEAFVGVIVFLQKDYSVAAGHRSSREQHTTSFQLTKRQPVGEGLGFIAAAERIGGADGRSVNLTSNVQYNAPSAILRADLGRHTDSRGRSREDYRLSVAGGVGYAGGQVALGRPVTESFGIVKVGELPGVVISLNGQSMGKTDEQGKLFIPTLASFYDNEIALSAADVPIEYSFSTMKKTIAPAARSGVYLQFEVSRLQAFSGKLKYRSDIGSRPIEYEEIFLDVAGHRRSLQTGRGGEFYLENLPPGRYASAAKAEGKSCFFDIVIPETSETFVDLGDVMCRVGQ